MTTVNVSRSLLTALRAQLRVLADKDPAVFGTGTSDDCPPWPIIEEMIHDLTKALASAEQPAKRPVLPIDSEAGPLIDLAEQPSTIAEPCEHGVVGGCLRDDEQPSEGDVGRETFEQWYVENAFDIESAPLGSRDCDLQWRAWQAARGTTPPQEAVAWRFRSRPEGEWGITTNPDAPLIVKRYPQWDFQSLYLAPPANDEAVRLLEWATTEGHHIVTHDTSSYEGEADFEYQVVRDDGLKVFGSGDTMLQALRSAFLTTHKQEGKDNG